MVRSRNPWHDPFSGFSMFSWTSPFSSRHVLLRSQRTATGQLLVEFEALSKFDIMQCLRIAICARIQPSSGDHPEQGHVHLPFREISNFSPKRVKNKASKLRTGFETAVIVLFISLYSLTIPIVHLKSQLSLSFLFRPFPLRQLHFTSKSSQFRNNE
jgi:hypothetical protein